VLPFQLVTIGQPIADFANKLFAADSYRDYLEVHGIGVQLTEAKYFNAYLPSRVV
jgi:5-methyltetrahydrofolate--homocysteine methyltransferase